MSNATEAPDARASQKSLDEQSTGSAAVTGTRDPEQIRREIDNTRRELGDTVEALVRKADVKSQAKRKVEETKTSASQKKEQLAGKVKEVSPDGVSTTVAQVSKSAGEHPLPFAAAGAFAAGFLAGRLTRH